MSNLPPGCSSSDIPGNRPEDMIEEEFWAILDSKFEEQEPKFYQKICMLLESDEFEEAITRYVQLARDLGYNRGYNEGSAEADLYLTEIKQLEEEQNE